MKVGKLKMKKMHIIGEGFSPCGRCFYLTEQGYSHKKFVYDFKDIEGKYEK